MGGPIEDEAALVVAARAGDIAAFTTLVTRYQQQVGGYVYRLVGERETAADLTQETFLRAYRSLASTRDPATFRAWLFRIATNLARDHLRRRKRIRWLPLDPVRPPVAKPPTHAVAEADLVRRVLARLAPDDRAVLLLCGLEGLSYGGAGAALGITANTARMRYARAKARFAARYRALAGEDAS